MSTGAGVVAGSNSNGSQYYFDGLSGITLSPDGNSLYVADIGNRQIVNFRFANRMFSILTLFEISNVPKDSVFGYVPLGNPFGLRFDSKKNLFIVDTYNSRIIKIASDNTVSALAGGGARDAKGKYQSGYRDGPAADALFNNPTGIAIDNADNIYVADMGNALIRKIDTSSNVTTLALEGGALDPGTNNTGNAGSGGGSSSSGGSGGGGAPSVLYLLALASLVIARLRRR